MIKEKGDETIMKRRKFKKTKKRKVIPDYITKIQINCDEVKEECEKRGFEVFFKCEGTVLEIRSKYDSWIAPITNNSIELYHDTKKGRHYQNRYWDIDFLLESTKSHDWYQRKVRGCNTVDYVMHKYNNGDIPKFKVN